MNAERTCGLKNSYIEAYLGEKEAGSFIPKWSKLEKRHWAGFNPAAWLFSFLWLFYKKMHREFAAFLAIFLILPVIVGSIAGISKMEGNTTPKAVYSELRRIPVTVDDVPCRCDGFDIKSLAWSVPWYKLMLMPVLYPGWYYFRINSEPAFYFGLFRVLAMLALNIFLGFYGDRLYFRSVRKKILLQLADMSTDEESSRLRVLEKSGRENSFKAQYRLAPLFALICVILPFFYDAVRIIYRY